MKNLAVIALTKNGFILGEKVSTALGGRLYIKEEHRDSLNGETYPIVGDFSQFVGGLFKDFDAIIFIMACGIVVRSIAPFLENKRKDPAVVVLDERGKYCISLLSGHVGGANELAHNVALITGGEAVITTATDINGVFAFDMFANKNNCVLENTQNLKLVSAALLHGKKVNLYSDYPIKGEIPENVIFRSMKEDEWDSNFEEGLSVILSNKEFGITNDGNSNCENPNFNKVYTDNILYLRPRNIIIGIGCRKGVDKDSIKAAILDFLKKANMSIYSIKHLASAQIKKDEIGIIEFCKEFQLPFVTVAMERIKEVEERFSYSNFVKGNVGVGGVCEAASVLSSNNGKFLIQKTVYKGITLALTEEGGEFLI